jgi:aryl-phospho-beta-D-glucosidase BglC (GH1 family)
MTSSCSPASPPVIIFYQCFSQRSYPIIGAYCILDIHNYARWNGGIVGQGGPSNSDFATFWGLLAAKYASQSRVIFGIMNEPHDVLRTPLQKINFTD